MKNKQKFWDKGYQQGKDYILIPEEVVDKVLTYHEKAKAALDIGCGTGDLARKLHKRDLEVTGVDLSGVALEQARELSSPEITYKQKDVEQQPLEDLGNFDLITLKLVLAFIDNKAELIAKIKRVLNSGGLVVIINPVIYNPQPDMPPKLPKISAPDEVTTQLMRQHFSLVDKQEKVLSKYHKMVTYIYRLQQS